MVMMGMRSHLVDIQVNLGIVHVTFEVDLRTVDEITLKLGSKV